MKLTEYPLRDQTIQKTQMYAVRVVPVPASMQLATASARYSTTAVAPHAAPPALSGP